MADFQPIFFDRKLTAEDKQMLFVIDQCPLVVIAVHRKGLVAAGFFDLAHAHAHALAYRYSVGYAQLLVKNESLFLTQSSTADLDKAVAKALDVDPQIQVEILR